MTRQESVGLKMIELFATLTDKELDSINKLLSVKKFKKSEVILYEEDTNKYMYIVLSGKVKAVQRTEDGKEILLAIHQAGEFFGEMSFIDGKTSPATIIAAEDCLINIISKDEFYATIGLIKRYFIICCAYYAHGFVNRGRRYNYSISKTLQTGLKYSFICSRTNMARRRRKE